MSTQELPPKKDYLVEIDLRFLTSAAITDANYRVFALLEHHTKKRHGQRKLNASSTSLAAILGLRKLEVDERLDALMGLGVLTRSADEDWSSIGEPNVGGLEINEMLGFEVGKVPKAKVDTRIFFAPDVGDRAARLWAAASIGQTDELNARQGWTSDELRHAADEIVKLGIAVCHLSKDKFVVNTGKLDGAGLRIAEFTCEELGKGQKSVTMDSAHSKKTAASSRAECKRRAVSRGSK